MNEPIFNSVYRVNGICQMGLANKNNGKAEISTVTSDAMKLDIENFPLNRMTAINQNERVTMKIDVSYTDHSHVIGKGGQSIKAIMTDTQCHIHFPDSNRTNTIEKSNQVSISGMSYGVEIARQKIRAILPLIYSFDIPFTPYSVVEQQDRLLMAQIQRMLEVTISYRPIGKLMNGTTIFVKGIVQRARQTIKAVNLIISHHFGQNIEQVPVMMTIEIDPKHHSFLLNQGGQNSLVHEIFQLTRATINFPDNTFSSAHAVLAANNPMGISGLFKKSTVNILGTAENTFEARQQLIGRLPVILMYDITIEEGVNLEMFNLNFINEKFDVAISIKLKLKQCTKSVIIRTTERNVQALFEVKHILNKLRTQYKPIIQSGIKQSIQPNMSKMCNNGANQPDTKYPGITFEENEKFLENNQEKSLNNFVSNEIEFAPMECKPTAIIHGNTALKSENILLGNPMSMAKLTSLLSSQRSLCNSENLKINQQGNNNVESGYFQSSNNGDSNHLTNLKVHNNIIADPENESHIFSNRTNGAPLSNINLNNTDWRAPGAEYSAKQRELKRSISNSPIISISDITKQYSGMNFVQIPESMKLTENQNFTLKGFCDNTFEKENKIYRDNNHESIKHVFYDQTVSRITLGMDDAPFITNEYHGTNHKTDNMPSNSCDNVVKILISLDLGRFVDCFIKNEVDFDTFCSLSEEDLKVLGVNTFGARRKLVLAINDIVSNNR